MTTKKTQGGVALVEFALILLVAKPVYSFSGLAVVLLGSLVRFDQSALAPLHRHRDGAQAGQVDVHRTKRTNRANGGIWKAVEGCGVR